MPYVCKSGKHFWTDPVDAKCCCNGMVRGMAVDPASEPYDFGVTIYRFWQMGSNPDEYDPDYEPPPVKVERWDGKE